MKKIILLLSIIILSDVYALDINDCLTDAESYGSHTHSITPDPSCFDLLKNEPDKIEMTSSDNTWKAYAYKHMLYLEKFVDGAFASRELLAGDQTQLRDIKSIRFETTHNKLLLLQQGEDGKEYLSYNLDFIGNVSPKTFLDHTISQGVSSVSYSTDGKELNLHFPAEVKVYSSTADSRFKHQADVYKVQLLRTESP